MGSINRATLEITEKLRRECSPEELGEIESWVRRHHAVDELRQRLAALTLPEQIALATRWLRQAPPDEARGVADDIVTTFAALRKTLNQRDLI